MLIISGKCEKLTPRTESFCIQRIISWLFSNGDDRNSDHYRLMMKVWSQMRMLTTSEQLLAGSVSRLLTDIFHQFQKSNVGKIDETIVNLGEKSHYS